MSTKLYASVYLGKALSLSASSNGVDLYNFVPAGTALTDCEVLMRFRFTSIGGTGSDGPGVILRTSAGAFTGYRAEVSRLVGGGQVLRWNKYLNGANSAFGTTARSYAINTWYWFRVSARGGASTVLSAKLWADGTAESGATVFNYTDSTSPLLTGGLGISFKDFAWTTIYIDFFSYATGTDTAPSS